MKKYILCTFIIFICTSFMYGVSPQRNENHGAKLNAEFDNIYFKFQDVPGIQVKVSSFTCPGSLGNYSVTGVGFQPRYVEFCGNRANAVVSEMMNGVMDYNGNQWAVACAGADDSQNSQHTNSFCIQMHYWNDNSIQCQAAYVSMDTDGFTIIFSSVNVNRGIYWKAVR